MGLMRKGLSCLFPSPFWPELALGATVWMAAILPAHGRVFTTRPAGTASLEHPESFGAREIYSGRFRINGRTAEMRILAGSVSVADTFRMLGATGKEGERESRHRALQGAVVGAVGRGDSEQRFLISSAGSENSCMVFVLKGSSGLFADARSREVPWPKSLPVLDPMQRPQLVIEHADAEFVFAHILLPNTQANRAFQSCRDKMADDGWDVEPLTGETVTEMADSGFAVLHKKGKTCWLEAMPGPTANQTLVTLLCKTP
ncbi:MAG: hypothetical protein HY360_09380 [Verrucomicrobia bacterium]|nr:hypothetical protein [Verrucomicrobiota bacterium]